LTLPIQTQAFNRAILNEDSHISPELVVIFKGWGISPKTLDILRQRGRTLIQFYPDGSLFSHGKWIPLCVNRFHYWFTTKSFGIDDVAKLAPKCRTFLTNHAFDPDVHRPMVEPFQAVDGLCCDVSLIAHWDTTYERILADLASRIPNARIKIWGSYWERAKRPEIQNAIQRTPITGDLYTKAMQQSKINLGLLRTKQPGAPFGDKVTARTFQIPAVGGFMLHERTNESTSLFEEGIHAAFFEGIDELVKKVAYYLVNETEREKIRLQGHAICLQNHSMDCRAREIITITSRDT